MMQSGHWSDDQTSLLEQLVSGENNKNCDVQQKLMFPVANM